MKAIKELRSIVDFYNSYEKENDWMNINHGVLSHDTEKFKKGAEIELILVDFTKQMVFLKKFKDNWMDIHTITGDDDILEVLESFPITAELIEFQLAENKLNTYKIKEEDEQN